MKKNKTITKALSGLLGLGLLFSCSEVTNNDSQKSIFADKAPTTYVNPILPGYHPDPSICRAGDYYYMVNSSFEWYPAMPIHRSKDLVNWELIGYGGSDPSKLQMPEWIGDSGGIFAVTIRYNKGTFYLITTHIGGGGNFFVTTTDPAGEWSAPVWIDAPGIDPSLFWDDDGRCYYIGHGRLNKEPQWRDQQGAWMQELDLKTGKLIGQRKQLTHGHASNATWTEGPHLYKVNGKYLLLVAEGGTGQYHAVTQFYSDNLWGPYEPSQINPVLTHRHLGNDNYIRCVGHADIIQTQNDEWWMVALGVRNFDGESYLSRETFLVPMDFEITYGSPTIVVNKGKGMIEAEHPRPNLPWTPIPAILEVDEFNGDKLDLMWNMLRSPKEKWYNLEDGELKLNVRPATVKDKANPSLLAQRLRDRYFELNTTMKFESDSNTNDAAGIVMYRSSKDHITLLKKGNEIILESTSHGEVRKVASAECASEKVELMVKSDGKNLTFSFKPEGQAKYTFSDTLPLIIIGENAGGQFNGPMVGVYATSFGESSENVATFTSFAQMLQK